MKLYTALTISLTILLVACDTYQHPSRILEHMHVEILDDGLVYEKTKATLFTGKVLQYLSDGSAQYSSYKSGILYSILVSHR